MIAKFLNYRVTKHDENDLDIHIDVELLNQPANLIDPTILLSFQDGKHTGSELLQRGGESQEDYILDEVEVLQVMVYLNKQSDDEIIELLSN